MDLINGFPKFYRMSIDFVVVGSTPPLCLFLRVLRWLSYFLITYLSVHGMLLSIVIVCDAIFLGRRYFMLQETKIQIPSLSYRLS